MRDVGKILDSIQEDIEVLLEAKKNVRLRIKKKHPGRDALKELDKINKQLDKLRNKKAVLQGDKEASFSDVQSVGLYLQGEGWKIKKTALYQHIRQGKLNRQDDGTIKLRDVLDYAQAFLQNVNTPKPSSPKPEKNNTDIIDKLKLKQRIARLRTMEANAKIREMEAKLKTGKYIEKDVLGRELSRREGIFRSDLENFFRGEMPIVVRIVKGERDMIPDAADHMINGLDRLLLRYIKNPDI